MLYKDYKFSEYTGMLRTYREDEVLLVNEQVEQNNEINYLITLQIAKDQINQADMFKVLHGKKLSSEFLSGYTAGKEYVISAVDRLLSDMMDEDEIVLTLHGGSEPQITLFDDEKIDDQQPPNLRIVEESAPDSDPIAH